MQRDDRVEELELTESDVEFGLSLLPWVVGSRRASPEEVEGMRERVRRDRELGERFEALRARRHKEPR